MNLTYKCILTMNETNVSVDEYANVHSENDSSQETDENLSSI